MQGRGWWACPVPGAQLQEFLPPPTAEKTAEKKGPEESDHDMGFGLLTEPLL